MPIRRNGAAGMSQLVFRVAVIEPERRRNRTGMQYLFVRGGGGGKLALGIKFVGQVELGIHTHRKHPPGEKESKQQA